MRVVAILDCAIVGDDEDAVAAAVAASDRQIEPKVGRARWDPIDGVVALDGKVDGCTETIFTLYGPSTPDSMSLHTHTPAHTRTASPLHEACLKRRHVRFQEILAADNGIESAPGDRTRSATLFRV